MQVSINISDIKGTIHAPVSKSSMQRACAAALLRKGTTLIYNAGSSEDDKAALNIIRQLGAEVSVSEDHLIITSPGFPDPGESTLINCGESGLAVRMFTPIAALSASAITMTGEGSLLKRPMHFFEETLPQLGVQVISAGGKLPLQIKGPLSPGDITTDGSLSSQFLTGLLFAFAKGVKETTVITVNNLQSKPYIDLTLDVMKRFGYKVEHHHYTSFSIDPVTENTGVHPFIYTAEGDWSGGAFLLVAGAIAGSVTVNGLSAASVQGDKKILQALRDSGANVEEGNDFINISAGDLQAFHFDATDCPDLFPPLVALASCCDGVSVIKGTGRLAGKESDRAATLKDVFGRMGIEVILKNDEMFITGGKLHSAAVHSHHDHRIAMAAAVAGLRAGNVTIENAEAVNKSYPAFYNDLIKIGGSVNFTA